MLQQTDYHPIPILRCKKFSDDFVPTCLSNGLIGISPGPNPLLQAKTLVSGFVSSHPVFKFENAALAPYPLGMDIKVGAVSMRQNPDLLKIESQSLDMNNGELTTRIAFAPKQGLKVELEILQFACRSVPSLLCQEISISASADMQIEIFTRIDKEGLDGSVYVDKAPYNQEQTDKVLGWQTDRSKLGIALLVPPSESLTRKALGSYLLEAKSKQVHKFCTIAAMVSELYHPDPHLDAIRLVRWGDMLGFDLLREQNRQEWAELWKSRIKVDAGKKEQKALDASFYYLHCSIHPSSKTSIPPFGLTQHDKYYGHIFWDADMWMLIPTMLASPQAAKAMLEFRLRGLEAAKNKAALFGFMGAMYPWEAGIDGSEVTPSAAHTGWGQHHVTVGVAAAFWEYQLATDDELFLKEATWPVLKAVAQWIESRGLHTDRGFEIKHVVGVDENLPGSNNAHMNLTAKMAMKAAVECAKKVGYNAPSSWAKIAEAMVIPVDKEKQVVVQDDDVKPQVGANLYAPGMLQLMFVHDPPVSPELLKRTYQFEEELRVKLPAHPSNPCSKLAPSFTAPCFAACATFFGERKKAAELFRHSWDYYALEPFGMIREYHTNDYGSYVTHYGSILQAVMLGFTGLRISDGDWCKYPVSLPEGWSKIEIDRIWVRSKPMKLIAKHGQKAVLSQIE